MKGQQESSQALIAAGILALGLIAGRDLIAVKAPSESHHADTVVQPPGQLALPVMLPDSDAGAALERRLPPHAEHRAGAAKAFTLSELSVDKGLDKAVATETTPMFETQQLKEMMVLHTVNREDQTLLQAIEGAKNAVSFAPTAAHSALPDETTKLVVVALAMLGLVAMLVDVNDLSDYADQVCEGRSVEKDMSASSVQLGFRSHSTLNAIIFALCAVLMMMWMLVTMSTDSISSPTTTPSLQPQSTVSPSVQELQEFAMLAKSIHGLPHDLSDEMVKVVLAALAMLGVGAMLVDSHEIGDGTEEEDDIVSSNVILESFAQRVSWLHSALRYVLVFCAILGAVAVMAAVSSYATFSSATLPSQILMAASELQELEALAESNMHGVYGLPDETAKVALVALALLGLVAMLTDAQDMPEGTVNAQEAASVGDGPETCVRGVPWKGSILNAVLIMGTILGAVSFLGLTSMYVVFFQGTPLPESQAISQVASPELEALAGALHGAQHEIALPDDVAKMALAALAMLGLAAMLTDLQEICKSSEGTCELMQAEKMTSCDSKSHADMNEVDTCEMFYIGETAEDEDRSAIASNVEKFYIGNENDKEDRDGDDAEECSMLRAIHVVSAFLVILLIILVSMCAVSSVVVSGPEFLMRPQAMQEIEVIAAAARSRQNAQGLPEEAAKIALAAFAMLGLVAMLVDAQEICESAEDVHKVDSEHEATNISLQQSAWPHPARHVMMFGALLVSIVMLAAAFLSSDTSSMSVPLIMSQEAVQELEALGRGVQDSSGANGLPDEIAKLALAVLVMIGVVAMLVDAEELSQSTERVHEPVRKDDETQSFVQLIPCQRSHLHGVLVLFASLAVFLILATVSAYWVYLPASELPSQPPLISPAAAWELEAFVGAMHDVHSVHDEITKILLTTMVMLGIAVMVTDAEEAADDIHDERCEKLFESSTE